MILLAGQHVRGLWRKYNMNAKTSVKRIVIVPNLKRRYFIEFRLANPSLSIAAPPFKEITGVNREIRVCARE